MRAIKDITIDAEGRDKGKIFRITEMAAEPAEKWALRAMFAMAKAGFEVSDDILRLGMAGLSMLGPGFLMQGLAGIPWDVAEPLLDQMKTCFQIVPSSGTPRKLNSDADDVEEMSTLLTLRMEWVKIHFSFFLTGKS